ncbi:MAG: hypothetical protein IKW57_01010 [Alphaproteobacteria bacterium]|nr:hypothetical protein [Alphaproteobacteria bacterium]
MAKKFTTNTNSFTIAHYILLFMVTITCIGIIAWVMINRDNPAPENNVHSSIIHAKNSDPCVKRVTETIERMWEFSPESVPQKYWSIAMAYINQPIISRTYGICMDAAFTCRPGQLLRDCDPCAIPSARSYAQQIHIADMISANCNQTE